jgi:hypothetical protein
VKLTAAYLDTFREKMKKVPKGYFKDYSIEVDGEFGSLPLLDVVRYLTEIDGGELSIESKDRITRAAVINRKVTIFYQGKMLETPFIMNSPIDPWDSIPAVAKNPTALIVLMELAVSKMIEKSLPPQAESDPPVAAETVSWRNGSRVPSGQRSGQT